MDDAANHGQRDRHLFAPGPKRILALDGGGVRGAIAVAFLARIEELLEQRLGHPVRLGDYFHLVGGTSTGAIIAGALALGYRTNDLKDFYSKLAPLVFRRPWRRWRYWRAKFDAEALREQIAKVVGERTLDSNDLITGFALVAKRLDTGSPWFLMNNPRAPYWETPPDQSNIGNRYYRLANLVRASTAAPFWFEPEVIEIVKGEPHGLFIDGGVSPHNNPALALLLLTQFKAFGLCWPTGPDQLLIVSVGTGSFRPRIASAEARDMMAILMAVHALSGLIYDGQNLVLALMQWLGRSPAPWMIDSAVGNLSDDIPLGSPLFKFLRYDVQLEARWLADVLDVKLGKAELERVRQLDNPESVELAYEIGRKAAQQQVKIEHLEVDKSISAAR